MSATSSSPADARSFSRWRAIGAKESEDLIGLDHILWAAPDLDAGHED